MKVEIQDIPAFHAWISHKIDPLTQNDPRKIAEYITAALQKIKAEKTADGLRTFLARKLDAFVDDKSSLEPLCEDIVDAIAEDKYQEFRDDPLFSSYNETENFVDTDRRGSPAERRSRSSSPRRSGGSRNSPHSDYEGDDRQTSRNIPEKRPIVSSTIQVVDDKRTLPKRGASGRFLCKDFTERGFCMRGNMCQFDHGTEPVIWQNRPMDMFRGFPPRVPVLPPQRHPGFPPMLPMGMVRPVMPPRFRPEPPGMPPFSRPPKPMIRPRELIGIHGETPMLIKADVQKREGDPLAAPSNLKRVATDDSSTNCSIQIRNVPPHLNNIAALNAHFAKYGSIVNVQIRYGGDPGAALVTFQNADGANRAFNSPEPVLNNRFISLSWNRDANNAGMSSKPGQTAPMSHAGPRPTTGIENTRETVTQGFTEGISVRYPVGSTRRPRAPRARAPAAPTRARPPHTGAPAQSHALTAHHRQIFLSLEMSKTEAELEKLQARYTALDEVISKVQNSISSSQKLVEQNRGKLDTDLSEEKRSELTGLLDTLEKMIRQRQQELQKNVSEKDDIVRKRGELEAKLEAQRKQQAESGNVGVPEYNSGGEEASVQKPAESVRGTSRGSRAGRSPIRGRGSRRAGRSSRAAHNASFNRSSDHRPKRLRITDFDATDHTQLTQFISESGATILADENSDEHPRIDVEFQSRFQAEAFRRDIPAFGGKRLTTVWLTDEQTSEPNSGDASIIDLEGGNTTDSHIEADVHQAENELHLDIGIEDLNMDETSRDHQSSEEHVE